MSESVQIPIYKIRSSIAFINEKTNSLEILKIDLNYLQRVLEEKEYSIQSLKAMPGSKHDFKLFYKNWPTRIKWKDFISEIAEPGEKILEQDISTNEGFILFIRNKRNKTIYAVTGGFGHTELQGFIDYQFGLDILSKLIKTEDKVLRAAKERNFIGGVLGSIKYFRGDYNLNENENFGNYYQELRARLDSNILKSIFKFKDDEIKKGGLCDAKSSFTIKKAISFQRLIEIVDILHSTSKKKSITDLNLIRRLNKSDKALVQKLETELYGQLFKSYNGLHSESNFEICHKFFDKYYDADQYNVSFPSKKKLIFNETEECLTFNDIITIYTNLGKHGKDQANFEKLIRQTRIYSFLDGKEITTGTLPEHLCTELRFNGKSYFLFNQEWFLLKPDFETILNSQCQELINANIVTGLIESWSIATETENAFNAKHIGIPNTLVFDKITPQNIEVCDILKWTDEEIYFIHVKRGFNNEMRNLGRQLQISARRIAEDLKTGKNFLGQLYTKLSNLDAKEPYFIEAKKQLKRWSKTKFLALFDNRRPVFILAVLDSSTLKRSFLDIKQYESNIAKFCLQQLRQEIRQLDFELKILEITKI